MSTNLWKITETKPFGHYKLIEFLVAHDGTTFVQKTGLEVTAGAFQAALGHAHELDLTEEDIDFIKKELATVDLDHFDNDEDDGENAIVDIYDVW